MKNIMLLFLSRLSLRGNLIGTKPIYDLGQGNLVETHTTNESAVRYLLNHLPAGEKLDRLYIFASQNVQGKPRQIDEPGFEGEYNDLAYFIQRLVQFWPEAKESIQVENYNENLQGQEAIGQIMDMSRDIQAYGQQQGDIRLHADLTGGFRSANMAMLNIIKLLQYSGMDIGYLLYSHMNTARDAQGNLLPSYVEDAHIIYSMLDLVSGAAEFVRFGSVDSIMEYYGSVTDKSPALEELLEAMDAETWITAEEAVALGFIDEIAENKNLRLAASAPGVLPAAVLGKVRNIANNPQSKENADVLKARHKLLNLKVEVKP